MLKCNVMKITMLVIGVDPSELTLSFITMLEKGKFIITYYIYAASCCARCSAFIRQTIADTEGEHKKKYTILLCYTYILILWCIIIYKI